MGAIRPWTTMRLLGAMLAFVLSHAALAQPVAARDAPVKLALIIANSGYESGDWPSLKNPVAAMIPAAPTNLTSIAKADHLLELCMRKRGYL